MSEANKTGAKTPGLEMSVMSLAREVWVLNDRVMMLEDLLSKAGVVSADALTNYTPSADRQAEIDKKSREFVTEMVRAAGIEF